MENPYPKARSENLVILNAVDEMLVYDLSTNKAHCLNETAAFVWNCCNGNATVDEIADSTTRKFGMGAGRDFVALAISQLGERDLLTEHDTKARGKASRRDVLKRLGHVTAAALPLIISVVTPKNASAIAVSCSGCTTNSQCINMTQCPSTTNCNQTGTCAPN